MDAYDVDVLARRIRRLYVQIIRMRPEWSRYTPSSRHDYVWKRAAELCLTHGFDPAIHVRALIESVERPYPPMLLGDSAIRRTASVHTSTALAQRDNVRSQLTLLSSRLGRGLSLATVLSDPHEDLSPAIRYTVAARANLMPIAAMYRDEARLELMLQPFLREVLRPMLPPSFLGVMEDVERQGDATSPHPPGARPRHA